MIPVGLFSGCSGLRVDPVCRDCSVFRSVDGRGWFSWYRYYYPYGRPVMLGVYVDYAGRSAYDAVAVRDGDSFTVCLGDLFLHGHVPLRVVFDEESMRGRMECSCGAVVEGLAPDFYKHIGRRMLKTRLGSKHAKLAMLVLIGIVRANYLQEEVTRG